MPPSFNDRQQRFIVEYVRCLNAAEAARRAGYSRHTATVQGPRLLTNAAIKAEISRRVSGHLEKVGLTAALVLKALERKVRADAEGDLGALFDSDGKPLPIHTLAQVQQDLLGGFEIILKNAKAGDGVIDEVLKVKLRDNSRYVEMAAKYFGLLVDKVELSGNAAQLDAILLAARARGKKGKA